MADEIKSTLGFDASQALDTLKLLDAALAGLESKLNTLSNSSLANFNDRAGKTVAALRQITSSANDAATALAKANTAVASGPASSGRTATRSTGNSGKLLTGDAAAEALNKLLGQTGATAQNAASQVQAATSKIASSASSNLGQAAQATSKFSISWETLVRVVQTQFIVRALSALRNAFGTAVEDATEFQRAVARIQTIAPGESFSGVAAGVRSISDSFNIPLLQAAEGVYQAVSNQVGDLGESLKFTATAAEFAKATNSSLADSIDLLSGAIKSFNLDVGSAEKVAGVFFNAIDKGRVTASELANTFGRVGPSAAQIGISLEEFAGGVAAISIKGVKTNEALTQFRGIITALSKPTDEMKSKLAQLGFSSSEAAIRTLGLDGVLESIARSANGSSQEFAKLFPNIRGLGGELSLTGKNLQDFVADVRSGEQVVASLNNQKFGTVFKTDAEQVTAAVNKIKNALIVDFGQAVLKSSKGILDLVGGAENLIAVGGFVVPLVVQVGAALGTMVIALQAARLASLALTSSLGPLGVAMLAIAAIPSIKNFIDAKTIEAANKQLNELTKANALAATEFAKGERQKLDEAKKADQERVKGALQAVAVINQTYLRDVETSRSKNKALVEDTERSLDKIVNARVQFIEAITKAITDSQEAVRDSNRRIADFKLEKSDLAFNRQTSNFSDAQKVFALVQRAAQTANAASAALEAAFRSGNKGDQDAAQRLFDRASSELQTAKGLAQGNKGLEAKVFNEQNALLDKRIGIEQRINNLQFQRQAALRNERTEQEKVVTELREQAKIAVDNTGIFDKNGDKFDEAQLAKRAAAREAALKVIATKGFQQKDFDVAKALGLGDFLQKIQSDVTQRPIQITFQVENAIKKVQTEMQKSLANIDVQLPFLKNLESALGKSLRNTPNGIQEGITEAVGEADVLRNKLSQVKINDTSIDTARKEIEEINRSLDARKGQRQSFFSNTDTTDPKALAATQTIETLQKELTRLAGQAKISQEDVDAVVAKAAALQHAGIGQLQADSAQIGELAARVAQIKKNLDAKSGVNLPPDATARLAVLNSVLQQIGTTNPGLILQTAATALQNTVKPMQNIQTAVGTTATDAERVRIAYEAAARVQLPAVPQQTTTVKTQALGGMIQGFNAGGFVKAMKYFDRGGFAPKGTDTIPAMLSPGEFVVNARSTRRFFSQLQAINTGVEPVFRANGGPVTNNNIGDVSIAVNGAQNPRVVGREVAKAIFREKRRGTIR